MVHILDRIAAWPLWIGLLAAVACVVVALVGRVRSRSTPEPLALLLCALPVGAAAFAVHAGRVGLEPAAASHKVHLGVLMLGEAWEAARFAGCATFLAAAATAALAPDLRRPALAALPAAAASVAWCEWERVRMQAFAMLPPDQKPAAWYADEPTRTLFAAVIVLLGAVAAMGAGRRTAVATALAPAMPALMFPAYLLGSLMLDR